MSKSIPIPHNNRIPAKYSIAITSFGLTDYQDFHDKMLTLANYYKETGYEIVFLHFGINRSAEEGKFYVRIYMNDLSDVPNSTSDDVSEVGTIIPTLGNIIESVELILFKSKNHE